MKKIFFALVSLVVVWGFSALADTSFPFIGRVKSSHVNVRASSSEDSEVLIQLNKGDLVTVLAEEASWLKIEPPKGCTFWIHSKMLKDGWVKTDGVNVRSGPGTHYSSVCLVNKDTSIDVVEKNGDWVRVLPPLNSSAWVHKGMVAYFSAPQDYQVKLQEEKESEDKFNQAEAFRTEELKKEMKDIQFDAILAKYKEIAERYPDAKEMERVQSRIKDTEAKKAIALREIEAAEMRAKRAAVHISEPEEKKAVSPSVIAAPREKKENKEEEEVLQTFVGKLRKVSNAPAPFTHQLVTGLFGSQRLCLIAAPPQLNLGAFQGKKVKVWGKMVSSQDSEASGVLVERLEISR